MHGNISNRPCSVTKPATVLLCLFALTAAGCASTAATGRWTHLDYHLAYNLPLTERSTLSDPLPESELVALTPSINIVSDNQRHEMLGGGVDWFRYAHADRLFKVAIRPPQLDLFGQDVMREMLTMTDGFVLHLGDACDVSNTGEFGRFAWDMQLATDGWAMTPGNHDGFFFGNSSRTRDTLLEEWERAAEIYEYDGVTIDSDLMQKDRVVSFYLAALLLQNQVWSTPLARSLGPDVERRFLAWQDREQADAELTFPEYWIALNDLEATIYAFADTLGDESYFVFEMPDGLAGPDQPHVRRVAWKIDKVRRWRSFILQEVAMGSPDLAASEESGAVSLLLMDTAQYRVQPSIDHGVPSGALNFVTWGGIDFQIAGETGGLHVDQNEAAQAFAADMRREGRNWIMASHHPYSRLGREAKPRFDVLRDAGGIPATLSSHSHTGEIHWNDDPEREGIWLEINIGSILDAPAEYRDFQVHRYNDRYVITSQRQLMAPILRDQGLLLDELPGYRPGPGDPDFYLNYVGDRDDDSDDADYHVKRVLLAAYLRMLRVIPTDHADQSVTRWPTGPDGARLDSDQDVIGTISNLLVRDTKSDVAAMTALLYDLREFERTRNLTDESRALARAYRLSQAVWASEIELRTWTLEDRAMDPELSFFLLPPPASSPALSVSP